MPWDEAFAKAILAFIAVFLIAVGNERHSQGYTGNAIGCMLLGFAIFWIMFVAGP